MSEAAKPRVVILQVHAENSGTQEIARLIAAGLTARGHDVHELYFFVRESSFFRVEPGVVICGKQPRSILDRIRLFFRVIAEINRLKPDVLLCLQWDGNLFGGVLAPLAGVPVTIAQQFTAPLMLPGWARFLDRLQGMAGSFSRIVVNSADVEQRYADYPRAYSKRVVRIDHGFMEKRSSLSKTEARAAFGLPEGVVMLGSVGRLAPQKHFAAAVRLLPQNKRWHLALCGQGVEEQDLRALAQELGCADRLHLTGEIHPDKVGDFLAALDIFVFPAISESFGLAVVEAAQAGLPVVANDLEILREVLAVEDEPCAMFVNVDDTAAFAASVEHLAGDAALQSMLTARGVRLRNRFPLDDMYDAYDRLLRSLV